MILKSQNFSKTQRLKCFLPFVTCISVGIVSQLSSAEQCMTTKKKS